MADPGAEARIRDLKRRLELDPGSRLFVALAEELRKTGRISEALSTLQKGLLAHPHYVSAQVALGRAYLEAGQITESIATFSKVLVADPGNLVSAKSLADIYLSRGETVEAIKKYKLYRALSGDRAVDEIVHRLDAELAPPPPPGAISEVAASPPPPPPSFVETPTGPIRRSRAVATAPPAEEERGEVRDPFDIASMDFEPAEASYPPAEPEPFPVVLSRDIPLVAAARRKPPEPGAQAPVLPVPAGPGEEAAAVTRQIRVSDFPGSPAPETPAATPAPRGEPGAPPSLDPQGRTLADLYFAQGHYAEALRIYDELAATNPFDEELRRMRRDAEARLLPASSTPGASVPDVALQRRLGKIRALKQWLSVVQAR
ncbi:MAG: tetratricopeptide repeat protein [Thermoanaerobaculia bacterium]